MQLNYKEFGSGPVMVILHGLFGSLDNWQTIAKQLAANFKVYIIDQRNHGKSPHTSNMNYDLMAEDLHVFFAEHGIRIATIIGHSMGGKTAMQFALEFPDLVEKLVVVDIAPKSYPLGHEDVFEALFSIDPEKLDNREEAENLILPLVSSPHVRQFLLKNLAREKTGGYRWKMNLPVIHEHYDEIRGVNDSDEIFGNPTLFIRGGDSDYISDDDFSEIQDMFPLASLVTVPGAGHWVHSEATELFMEELVRFL